MKLSRRCGLTIFIAVRSSFEKRRFVGRSALFQKVLLLRQHRRFGAIRDVYRPLYQEVLLAKGNVELQYVGSCGGNG